MRASIKVRVGADLFLDKIADIPKHKSFNKGEGRSWPLPG
jgi:hypothetical protein